MSFKYLLGRDNIHEIDNNLLNVVQFVKNTYNIDLYNKRILEIGIGTGIKTFNFAKMFKSYYAIEPNKELYDALINLHKNNNSEIKIFNCNLNYFVDNTIKKFSLIYLENVIQFFDFNDFINQTKKILRSNGFILFKNKKTLPFGWGTNLFNESSSDFDQNRWDKYKQKLNEIYTIIKTHTNLVYSFDSDTYHYFLLKM